jgi:hypothetical protein
MDGYVCMTKTSDSIYYIGMYDVIHVPALNSSEWSFLVAVSMWLQIFEQLKPRDEGVVH